MSLGVHVLIVFVPSQAALLLCCCWRHPLGCEASLTKPIEYAQQKHVSPLFCRQLVTATADSSWEPAHTVRRTWKKAVPMCLRGCVAIMLFGALCEQFSLPPPTPTPPSQTHTQTHRHDLGLQIATGGPLLPCAVMRLSRALRTHVRMAPIGTCSCGPDATAPCDGCRSHPRFQRRVALKCRRCFLHRSLVFLVGLWGVLVRCRSLCVAFVRRVPGCSLVQHVVKGSV